MLPAATADGKGASLIDASFTSTSAMCVTGLVVQDTPVYFSRFGHVVILILMQLGGLGIMTSYVFFSIAIGKRLHISQQVVMKVYSIARMGGHKKNGLVHCNLNVYY